MQNNQIKLEAKLFKGLGDESRLAILETMLEGEKNVSEVVDLTGLSQPNVSMHLKCLQGCGLVEQSRKGRHIYYRHSTKDLKKLVNLAKKILKENQKEISECKNTKLS
jgi:DNA-binding transcriptional ArsR family regulator